MVGGSIRRTKDKERQMNRAAKALLVVLALAGATNTAWSAGVTLTLKAGLFFPSDSIFREDYKNVIAFGGELAVPLAGGLHVWAGAEYFGDNGTLPITLEETKLRISAALRSGPTSARRGPTSCSKKRTPSAGSARAGSAFSARAGSFSGSASGSGSTCSRTTGPAPSRPTIRTRSRPISAASSPVSGWFSSSRHP
jgi:hypothetical protein